MRKEKPACKQVIDRSESLLSPRDNQLSQRGSKEVDHASPLTSSLWKRLATLRGATCSLYNEMPGACALPSTMCLQDRGLMNNTVQRVLP